MYEVRVTADFAAAHFLRDYNGKCENLHGHNYKVYAHVRGALKAGMLPTDVRIAYGIPLSLGSKSIFFDRNPGAVLR